MRWKTFTAYTLAAFAVQLIEHKAEAYSIPESNDFKAEDDNLIVADKTNSGENTTAIAQPETLVIDTKSDYGFSHDIEVKSTEFTTISLINSPVIAQITPPETENITLSQVVTPEVKVKEDVNISIPLNAKTKGSRSFKNYIEPNREAAKLRPPQQPLQVSQEPAKVTDSQVDEVRTELENLQKLPQPLSAPAMTIYNPTGFGADKNRVYFNFSSQLPERYSGEFDPGMGIGIGLFDARKTVGLEISYSMVGFGNQTRSLGTGGLNAKLHRQFSDGWGVAVGWNGFLTTGVTDFQDSVYAVASKIFRTRSEVEQPFSRIVVTLGIGNGQFRTEDQVTRKENTFNPFGSIALRVARPISAIAEWTGQDFGIGVSLAPFRKFNLVITPAIRDIFGTESGARFVLTGGFSFNL